MVNHAQTREFTFIIPFPPSSEMRLKTLLDLGYFACFIPFRIIYNNKKRQYILKKCHLRQIISVLQLMFILMEASLNRRLGDQSLIPGPLKLFMTGFLGGSYVVLITYLIMFNLPRTRILLLQLINLLSNASLAPSNNYRLIGAENLKQRTKTKFMLLLGTYFHHIFLACIMLAFSITPFIQSGIKTTVRNTWNMIIETIYPQGKVKHYRQMTWWMKLAGVWITVVQIETTYLFATSITVIFLTARTLQQISSHFIDNLEYSRIFCFVTDTEVVFNFKQIRQAFSLISMIFTQLTFIVVVYFSMSSCVMMVFMFADMPESFPFATVCLIFYFLWTLFAAADASKNLRKISKFVRFSSQKWVSSSNACSLQRALMLYETGSLSVGLKVSDIFIFTYVLVASIITWVLSNATIVLQSMDSYKKSMSSRPPPPDDE